MMHSGNRETWQAGMKLLLWAICRQRGWKWMSQSFLGYVGILYGVFVVGGFALLTHRQISVGFLGFHGGGVAMGIMIGAALWPVASVLQGVLCWHYRHVIRSVEAHQPEQVFDPRDIGWLSVWLVVLGSFCAYVPAQRWLYAPFHPVMLTLLLSVVLLRGVRCVRALTSGGAWLLAAQADAGNRPDDVEGAAEGGETPLGEGAVCHPAPCGHASCRQPSPGESGRGADLQAANTADVPDAADTLKIAIVDWKGLLIFAAVALLTTVVVGFSLILTPFG
jgi:membrane protein